MDHHRNQPASAAEEAEINRIRDEYEDRGRRLPKDFYSWRRSVNLYFHVQLCRSIISLLVDLKQFPLYEKQVLDIGCGAGTWLLEFSQWGAASAGLCGIDLDPSRVKIARARLPGADIRPGSAARLPWGDGVFDMVTQFTVFTSILDPTMRRSVAREMMRVLRPGGLALWYDFRINSPTNRAVRRVGLPELRTLFPGTLMDVRSVTLAPPIARRVVPLSWPVALCIETIPWLRTHYLAAILPR